MSGNRFGMFIGPAGTTGLAQGIGEQPSYLVGAAIVASVAVAWLPLRRMAATRLH